MKKNILTLLFALVALTGQAQTKIWNEVVSGYSNASSMVTITKVAMFDDRTELTLHIDFIKGQWIRIAKNTVIKANGIDYAVKDATVLTLGEQYTLPEDTLNFVLTFEPIPTTTKIVDLVEPNGWVVTNIRSAKDLPKELTDTYWRDEATGDWFIGFAKEHVIYQNDVWDIVAMKEKKDSYVLTLAINNIPKGWRCAIYSEDMLSKLRTKIVKVGKMKKGLRTIAIDDAKPVTCSPITTAALPDYPTKDTRTGFVDNGYDPTDSVTIIGWLKDMPPQAWQKSKEFEVSFENILTDEEENAYAKMDSLGRFAFKMSLLNSSEVFVDWGRTTVNAFLEPGKTYFFLYDFETGQKLWMGDDVRVQNELLTHPRSRSEARVPYDQKDVDIMAYWAQADSARQVQMDYHKTLQQSHPTLSQRYIDYVSDYYRMIQGRNMMQCRFYAKDNIVPQEYMDYVGREFWRKAPKPYTLYRDFTSMNNDFLDQIVRTRKSENFIDIFKRFEKEGKITLTAEEKHCLEEYPERLKQVEDKINATEAVEEKQKIVDAFNNSELVTTIDAFFHKNIGLLNTYSFQQVLDVVDSLGCDQPLRDLVLAQRIYQQIDATRQPVDPAVMAFAEQLIKTPPALDIVKNLNDKYLALQQRDISKSSSLKSAEDVANMSDGEKILRKIIEPYKGKIILLDIWGTWCGPCKDALSHSAEEYERLKEFDMVFLYLANRSGDEAWKNVIKEYNVLGDNVVHYNLPSDQQSAIEHFLKVNAFPTYKLIDRDGNILDVNADPRNLEGLVQLLEKL